MTQPSQKFPNSLLSPPTILGESLPHIPWENRPRASKFCAISITLKGQVVRLALKDDNVIFSRFNDPDTESFSFALSVTEGTILDFAVGTGSSGYGSGTTPLELTISTIPEPEPGMLVFGLGLLGIAVAKRKFSGL